MKKTSLTALLLALLLVLAACGGNSGEDPQGAADSAANSGPVEDTAGNGEDETEGGGEEAQPVIAPEAPAYTAADITGVDPHDPNISIDAVDFTQQPYFPTEEGMEEFIQSCIDSRCRSIIFATAKSVKVELDGSEFCNKHHVVWTIPKMMPGDVGKQYILRVTYYPGDNVANAYLTGDKSALSEDELVLYDAAVAWLEENITDGMTDYEKCVTIHDFLCTNVAYDMDLLNALNTSFTFDLGITAYGALIDHNTICQGYADAFDMLTSMLGMNCTQIYGTGSGELHNWNMIELDGNWYHVDCTFDRNLSGPASTKYLFATGTQMRMTHTWDYEAYPEATDDSLYIAEAA